MGGLDSAVLQFLPSVVMLIVGFALVVVEMYVPGFGAPGIIGTLLLVGGVIALRPTPFQALLISIVIVALLCIALSLCIRSASKGRLSKSKYILRETSIAQDTGDNALSYYVGQTGKAVTVLRPAGIGEFSGVKLNVVSDGEFINAGEAIRVESVEGNRICVQKV
ncbi:MAG: NfeD family protein [Clostridia bacterium]|nr:NfeD family protein [Clostridia bacterium]